MARWSVGVATSMANLAMTQRPTALLPRPSMGSITSSLSKRAVPIRARCAAMVRCSAGEITLEGSWETAPRPLASPPHSLAGSAQAHLRLPPEACIPARSPDRRSKMLGRQLERSVGRWHNHPATDARRSVWTRVKCWRHFRRWIPFLRVACLQRRNLLLGAKQLWTAWRWHGGQPPYTDRCRCSDLGRLGAHRLHAQLLRFQRRHRRMLGPEPPR